MALNLGISIDFHSWHLDCKDITYRPLGSDCLDQVGVQRITVDAQWGGKCSSNMHRYQ